MPTHWAIDLGTSNTTICEDRSGRPHVVNLPDLAKLEPVTQTPVMPSCVCVMDTSAEAGADRAGSGDLQLGRAGHGIRARVQAPSRHGERPRDGARRQPDFHRAGHRRALPPRGHRRARSALRRRSDGYHHRHAQRLLRDIPRRTAGDCSRPEAPRLVGTPVGATAWKAGDIVFRTLDEPVAAALGYGVDVGRATTLVAFDFGGGSMEAAVVRTHGAQTVETGRAEVLAKQAVELGGDDVDRWILERFVPSALHDWPEWEVALRWEAERVKLLASAGNDGDFTFRNESFGKLDYHVLHDLLAGNGLYERIRGLLDALLTELRTRHGVQAGDIDDVILEGGSTLLPEVRNVVGDVLGRDKVREWLPFEAVARGACIFAGGAHVEDFIYHDYALRVLPADDRGDAEYELLIPGGTSFPTADDFVTRYYAPGFDGQQHINLFICEVGRVAGQSESEWTERANGSRYFVPRTAGERAFCLCLNEADPALPLTPAGRGTARRGCA